MIPPAKKSPTMLALDAVAGSSRGPGGGEPDGEEASQGPDADQASAQDPEGLLDSIQSNIDQLRAKLSA